MKVIVDNKIPYIKESLEKITTNVVYLSGSDFNSETVKDADALIIRTRTRCNKELLEGSKVQFIATATIGYDHIDTEYCREKGIIWTNAPGCNAGSVMQYVQSCLFLLQQQKQCDLSQLCLGIVGVGNVGTKIRLMAQALGMRILLNDPPRGDRAEYGFVDLETIVRESDIITFHTPLNREGKYQTLHLADHSFFNSLQRTPIIINTSRGEVIETEALLEALEAGQISQALIDVWENEPNISLELLEKVFIGTPHIAGYSADGKANATRMSLQSLCRFFSIEAKLEVLPPSPHKAIIESDTMANAYLKIYNPQTDSATLKQNPFDFEWFRGNYPVRREPEAYTLKLS